jgi:molybdopterin synthase sulfur carrier subunit
VFSYNTNAGECPAFCFLKMRDSSSTETNVRVVYLARLREAFASAGETLDVAADTSVGALLDRLRGRGGAFAVELAPGRAYRVAVNHVLSGPETIVRAGDEVAVFPPVTGG